MSDELNGLTRLREDVLSGKLNRRAVLKRGAMLGLSAPAIAGLLAACGNDSSGDDTDTSAASSTAGTGGARQTETTAEGEATRTEATDEGDDATPSQGSAGGATTGERGGGGNLRLLYWQAPVILNPHLANGTKDFHASRVCLEPLVDFDANGDPILFLAEEYPSVEAGTLAEDGTSVTWKLRQGVKWHDGEDFNADDVIFTYNYITDEATATTTIGRYLTIDTIDKVDDYTVKINFKQPNPAWYDPFTSGEGIILPEHVFKDSMGAESRNAPANLAPIGTGPFKVREFRPGDTVLYDIFMDYWDPGKPRIDAVEMKGGGDVSGAARAVLQSGEADWAWNLQIEPAILEEIASGGLGVVDALPGGGTERIMINFANPREEVNGAFSEPTTKHPIWSDVRARNALALMIQRDVIAEQLYGPGGVAASNQYDEPAKYINPDITWEYNLDKAKALLDEMGFTSGDIIFQTSINTVRQKTQEIVKQDMEKLGFSVEIKSVDASVYFSTDQGSPDTAGKFYADLEMHTNGPSIYPATWFERYRTDEIAQQSNGWSGSNYFRYSNPEMDKMHDQVRVEMDEATQVQLFQDMLALSTVTDYVEVPVVNRTNLAAKSNRIQGYVGSPWSSNPVYEIKNWTLEG